MLLFVKNKYRYTILNSRGHVCKLYTQLRQNMPIDPPWGHIDEALH